MARKKRSSRSNSVKGVLSATGVQVEPVEAEVVPSNEDVTDDQKDVAEQPRGAIKQLRSKRQRILIYGLIALASLSIFALALFGWLWRFSLIQARVAGVGVHNSTSKTQLNQELQAKVSRYKIDVLDQNVAAAYNLSDAGITVDVPATVDKAFQTKKPRSILARAQFWKNETVSMVSTVDDAKFSEFVKLHMAHIMIVPENATLVMNDNGEVTIVDGKLGQAYTLKDPKKDVLQAVSSLTTKTFVLQQRPISPDIGANDISSSKQKVASLLAQKITFSISGQKITPKPVDIKQWVELTPVPSSKTIDVNVNSGKVLSYLNKVSRPYVQPPVTQIMMTDPSGEQQILIPGRSGVDIVDKEAVAADVAKRITEGAEPLNIDLPVKYASFKTINAQPHDKWIVVDTTTKRMYAYEQTTLVRTFLISAGAPRTPTVTGEYRIYSKAAKQDMRGANADGSRYFQPNVQWVNYFYADYAIHGNYWRPVSYFGNVNSSHGCVGILNSDAKWLYDWAPVGTTVIVHR